jgi:hypothetical protein
MELARDIERWLADDPVSVLSDSLLDRCGRWFRRNRSAAKLLALATTAVLAISLFSAFGFQRLAQHEHQALIMAQTAREQSLRMAAQFAAKTVAGEIDLRWRILETEASDQDIRELLMQHDPLAPNRDQMKQLQAWLDSRFIEHKAVTRPASWLIADSIGRQLARSPAADTIGEMFQFRDYYHGQGKDLDPTLAVEIPPLRQVHRSMVFNSQASGQDLVAFSVPIWSGKPGSDERRVLGVLAMTVAAGEFHILKTALSKDQIAVLVDTRPDFISGTERRGRVLQHPRISNQPGPTDMQNDWRLPEDRVDQLIALRNSRLQGTRSPSPALSDEEGLSQAWTNRYRDPLHHDPTQPWLAAFEPVFVDSRSDEGARDSGWVVIIQMLAPKD